MATRVSVTRDDITGLVIDVVVNAANSSLIPGGGVDRAIHQAGGPNIRREAEIHAPLDTGDVLATTAGHLAAKIVIHTVGPVWGSVSEDTAVDLLRSCYRSSLDLTVANRLRSVAFPNISTGVYGFPKPLAAKTVLDVVTAWRDENSDALDRIVFVCFDHENYTLYSERIDSSPV